LGFWVFAETEKNYCENLDDGKRLLTLSQWMKRLVVVVWRKERGG
jgi:hypothetical protein